MESHNVVSKFPRHLPVLSSRRQCKNLVQGAFLSCWEVSYIQSNLGYPNVDYPKQLGYSKATDSSDFFLYYLLQ